jgi:hypothetical protein
MRNHGLSSRGRLVLITPFSNVLIARILNIDYLLIEYKNYTDFKKQKSVRAEGAYRSYFKSNKEPLTIRERTISIASDSLTGISKLFRRSGYAAGESYNAKGV